MPPRQIIHRPAGWTPAPAPVWRAALDLERLVAEPPVLPGDPDLTPPPTWRGNLPPRPSAVLVALTDALPEQPGPHVLLTRRAAHLRQHAGEVSFPGGRIDSDETAAAAAMREAFEEVALDPQAVRVRGELPRHQTLSSASYIVPVVATVPEPPPLVPSPAEVEAAYWVPVAALITPGVHHREFWTFATEQFHVDFFELADDLVWGATARILVSLLALDE